MKKLYKNQLWKGEVIEPIIYSYNLLRLKHDNNNYTGYWYGAS